MLLTTVSFLQVEEGRRADIEIELVMLRSHSEALARELADSTENLAAVTRQLDLTQVQQHCPEYSLMRRGQCFTDTPHCLEALLLKETMQTGQGMRSSAPNLDKTLCMQAENALLKDSLATAAQRTARVVQAFQARSASSHLLMVHLAVSNAHSTFKLNACTPVEAKMLWIGSREY